MNGSLSIVDLVNSGEFDCKLAGLFWLLMEHRASVLVAAGPSFAGKTTLLHALLDFLPPGITPRPVRGYYEDFKFVDSSPPDRTYLVVEEFSRHGFFDYEYLWGIKAVRTFNLVSEGYALGGTIHARNSEEVVYILNRALGLPLSQISNLGLIVMLRAVPGQDYFDEPVRRVVSVDLLLPEQEGLAIQVLAARRHLEAELAYLPDGSMQQVLAAKGLAGKHPVAEEIGRRVEYLTRLIREGCSSRSEVRGAILDYYRSQPAL